MIKKKKNMMDFWSARAREYKNDPRANTNDVWLREIEIKYINQIISQNSFRSVMDFGCANGFTTKRISRSYPVISFTGIDINPGMIKVAEQNSNEETGSKLKFFVYDFIKEGRLSQNFDFIYCVRVLQNLESKKVQKDIINILIEMLNTDGYLLYIESYEDYYDLLNKDREKLGLEKLPVHSHLTLLNNDFDKYVSSKLQYVSENFIASTYYLVTRLLYSRIAEDNNEKIDYNHPIHQIGAQLPQFGNYGPLKAMLFKKL
jgi:SAM-dependent methyltransferase